MSSDPTPRSPTSDPRRVSRSALGALLTASLAGFAAIGCGGGNGDGGDGGPAEQADTASADPPRFVVITHGQSADPFWSVVSNGVEAAGRELGVTTEYQAPGRFDMVEMANLIEAAVASRPDGIAVSLPDADALSSVVSDAVDQGLPVVSLNSGTHVFRDLGIETHVGQPEYDAGFAAGERMAEQEVSKALCVNQEVGNLALDRRCRGFSDALGEAGATSRVLAVELADPADTEQRVQGALEEDTAVDAVLTLGPMGAVPALAAIRAVEEASPERHIHFATFDLSPEVLNGIRQGDVLFAVDQQPYLQGWMAVATLALRVRTGTHPVGVVRTGPAFVTGDNVEEVARGTRQGVR